VHFLAVGLVLFVAYVVVWPNGATLGDSVILVNRDALLTHIQYRSKAFEPTVAAAKLDALSEKERQSLIDDYVREEALHREALALGMDANDYIIKRRLIQKVEFLAQGFADATAKVDEEFLQTFFAENQDDYRVDPYVTFTHVFFDAEKRRGDAAQAARKLKQLNAQAVPFSAAPRHGDRFLYHVNYVERTPAYVASHFGPKTAQAIFSLEPGEGRWHGPYESPYGVHLVLVAKSEAGRTPALDEIRDRVEDDARRALAQRKTEAAIQQIIDSYEVRLVEEVNSGPRVASAEAAE
jgi:hypothetical protein